MWRIIIICLMASSVSLPTSILKIPKHQGCSKVRTSQQHHLSRLQWWHGFTAGSVNMTCCNNEEECSHTLVSIFGIPSLSTELATSKKRPESAIPRTAIFGETVLNKAKPTFENSNYPICVYPGTFQTYVDLTFEQNVERPSQTASQSLEATDSAPSILQNYLPRLVTNLNQDLNLVPDLVPDDLSDGGEYKDSEGVSHCGSENGDLSDASTLFVVSDKIEEHVEKEPHSERILSISPQEKNEQYLSTSEDLEIANRISGTCFMETAKLGAIHETQSATIASGPSVERPSYEFPRFRDHAPKNNAEAPILSERFSPNPLPCLKKPPLNCLSCEERKRIIVTASRRPEKVTKAMQDWIYRTESLLEPWRCEDDCWFHPSPPAARRSSAGALRPYGKIQKVFTWQDDAQVKHSIVVNYGIVSKLMSIEMTNQQKDGFVNRQWHLSHLCGNWTCLNPKHTTIEPGEINISRNNCFSHRSGCFHQPTCLKDKKVALGSNGKPLDQKDNEFLSMYPKQLDGLQMESFDEENDYSSEMDSSTLTA